MGIASLVLAAALFAGPNAAAQELEGAWEGTLDVGAQKLRAVMQVTPSGDGLPSVSLDSIDQDVHDIPGRVMSRSGDQVEVLFISVGAAYKAKVAPDAASMVGTWSQGGREFPLTLVRRKAAK